MSDTIFYTLKLKRGRTPQELFEKLKKYVKPKGVTKSWVCDIDDDSFVIDFGDGESETFAISFDKKNVCDGFCKVYFPLDADTFDNEMNSEFKALLNMLYSARSFFSQMDITDDYGLTESFFDSKKYKIVFRELTEEEIARARGLFGEGHTSVREFIIALMFDLRGLPYSPDYEKFINKESPAAQGVDEREYRMIHFVDSFLYETAYYKNEPLRNNTDYYGELNGVCFSAMVFGVGIEQLTGSYYFERAADPKSAQVLRLYNHSYYPALETASDDFERCVLAYRYFVSIYEWLGFSYAGKIPEEKIIPRKTINDMLRGYRVEQLPVERDGKKIFALISIPMKEEYCRDAAVILSHGYNCTHEDMSDTFHELALHGVTVVCYDFCGGSTRSKSEGSSLDMSVRTEQADLRAVIAATRATAKTDNIYLYGESQGGFVSALTMAEPDSGIAGAFLVYPAFCIPDDWGKREPLTAPVNFMGMEISDKFRAELPDYDVFEHISGFDKPVLLFHGDADKIVSLDYSKRIEKVLPDCKLTVYENEGHGFSNDNRYRTNRSIMMFLTRKHPINDTERRLFGS